MGEINLKILELTPHAYFKGHKGFEKNNSGFAYAVSDICEALSGCGNKVYLLTQSAITDEFDQKGIVVLKKRWANIIFNMNFKDIIYGLRAIKGSSLSVVEKLKTVFYYLNRGYAEKVICEIKPDVIQIQAIGNYTLPFMLAASHCGVPFIVSNHGLASFLDNVDPKLKRLEGNFFKIAENNNTLVTTVSSGIKKRLIEFYQLNGDNIQVVHNGFKTVSNDIDEEKLLCLKKRYGVKEDTFVYICVGSISYRKNQLQIARAFKLLVEKINNVKLFFVGYGPQYAELENYVETNGLKGKIEILGNIEHSEMPCYYSLADCTIMASVDEGFGLPIIEAYSVGVPAVMYADLDAAEDLFSPESTVLVQCRSDKDLAQGLIDAKNKKWDSEKIKEYSLRFTNKQMGEKYHILLNRGINESSIIPFEEVESLVIGRG